MTNNEFKQWIADQMDEHPILRHDPPYTINELVWVLRQDVFDYALSWSNKGKGTGWSCVPSVKECFIPAKDLVRKMEIVEYTEDEYDGVIYRNLQLKLL